MGTSLFDQNEPSSIGDLMGLLSQTPASAQGAGPMPHIDPPQQPQTAQPPAPPQHKRLVDRIHDRLQGLLDAGRPSDPGGYEGLLSPEEIKKARPSFLSSLAGVAAQHEGGPSGAYQERLDRLVQMHQIATGIGEHNRVMAARQQMGELFPAQPNETHDQTNARLEAMYTFAVQHGDLDLAKQIGGVVDDIVKQKQFLNAGDGSGTFFDPATKTWLHDPSHQSAQHAPVMGSEGWLKAQEALASIKQRHHVGGSSGEPLVQVEGPDGPVWTRRSQAAGMPAKNTTHVESAMGVAAKARLTAAVSEMNNAHAGMEEYERGLANGSVKINAGAQLLQRLGNSFTHDDPVSMILQSSALAALNQTDPALARYIRRGLSFAEGESMVSQRPSDFRTKMAAFLSTAASGASPDMVHDIQSRRTSILTPLNSVSAEHSTPKGTDRATGKKGSKLDAYRHLLK